MIVAKDLCRDFGSIKAVENLSFSVEKGEVLGFLGPNGAGKSTTMKMLTGFLKPSSGTATVAGFDILDNSLDVRKSIGYLPENAPLYGEMTVLNFLNFISEVRGLGSSDLSGAVGRSIEVTSLEKVKNQRIETLSKGFRRRVGLAQAILHDPDILILDEPTDGLDPNQKHEVRSLIESISGEKCIILSTHILEEVEEVCSRALIIADGKLVADDSPSNLKKQSPSAGAISITFTSQVSEKMLENLKSLDSIKEIHEFEVDQGKSSFTLFPKNGEQPLFELLEQIKLDDQVEIDSLQVEDGRLDEVFRKITQS